MWYWYIGCASAFQAEEAGPTPAYHSSAATAATVAYMPLWWNGRHSRLKICCLHERAGSSPASGTTLCPRNRIGICTALKMRVLWVRLPPRIPKSTVIASYDSSTKFFYQFVEEKLNRSESNI